MSQRVLDRFGEILMNKVRDETITDWDMILSGEMKGATAQVVRKAIFRIQQRTN